MVIVVGSEHAELLPIRRPIKEGWVHLITVSEGKIAKVSIYKGLYRSKL